MNSTTLALVVAPIVVASTLLLVSLRLLDTVAVSTALLSIVAFVAYAIMVSRFSVETSAKPVYIAAGSAAGIAGFALSVISITHLVARDGRRARDADEREH